MQRDEPGDRRLRPAPGRSSGSSSMAFSILQVRLVGRVVGQHVEDEPLLDRLAHRVQVERLVPVRRRVRVGRTAPASCAFGVAVKAKNDRFGCDPGRHLGGEQRPASGRRPPRPARLSASAARARPRRRRGRAEDLLQLLGRLTGLRRVGLVDDHRVASGREFLDLSHHERELLERRDDDPGLLTRQRLGELRRVRRRSSPRRRGRARTGRSCPATGGPARPGR